MTMQIMSLQELEQINGGGWDEVFNATIGAILVSTAPVVGVIVGIACPPAGVAVGGAMVYGGYRLLEDAVD